MAAATLSGLPPNGKPLGGKRSVRMPTITTAKAVATRVRAPLNTVKRFRNAIVRAYRSSPCAFLASSFGVKRFA